MGQGSCPHKPFDLSNALLLHKVCSAAAMYNDQYRMPNTTKFLLANLSISKRGVHEMHAFLETCVVAPQL